MSAFFIMELPGKKAGDTRFQYCVSGDGNTFALCRHHHPTREAAEACPAAQKQLPPHLRLEFKDKFVVYEKAPEKLGVPTNKILSKFYRAAAELTLIDSFNDLPAARAFVQTRNESSLFIQYPAAAAGRTFL